MMKKIIILLLSFFVHAEMISSQTNGAKIDSVAYVAFIMLDFNDEINSYEVSELALDWVENEHPDWVLKYFPEIIEKYDCTLLAQFTLAISLYIKGNPTYLCTLWNKHASYSKRPETKSDFDPVYRTWEILDYYKIDPYELKGCK